MGSVLFRLGLATLCAFPLGMHYELRERPGGLRAHLFASLGAATFCLVGVQLTDHADALMRAIQGITSGVGFIGAAAVLHRGQGIQGVANAASIWIAAAIGCACGFGHWTLAVAVATCAALVNFVTYRVAKLTSTRP